jgi:hypothetical protein
MEEEEEEEEVVEAVVVEEVVVVVVVEAAEIGVPMVKQDGLPVHLRLEIPAGRQYQATGGPPSPVRSI